MANVTEGMVKFIGEEWPTERGYAVTRDGRVWELTVLPPYTPRGWNGRGMGKRGTMATARDRIGSSMAPAALPSNMVAFLELFATPDMPLVMAPRDEVVTLA